MNTNHRSTNLVIILGLLVIVYLMANCSQTTEARMAEPVNILLLHHSIGKNVWMGSVSRMSYSLTRQGAVERYIDEANKKNGTDIRIQARVFPKKFPYGLRNYPFDYWNIWVNHAGDTPFENEPTLEILSRQQFDVISWKHCYPVCKIKDDPEDPSVDSQTKCIGNYKLQYNALKKKMRQFPHIKFIVWTGPAYAHNPKAIEYARRAKKFFDWVREEWDEQGDNIFLWDFYYLETEGRLFMKDKHCREPGNSHPNKEFAEKAARNFAGRVMDVVEGRGDTAPITGGNHER